MARIPTMKDVAKMAGVSLGTVSKVINGIPVRKESKEKVDAAVKELNYELNVYAQGLKMSKSGLIAIIIPDILNPFYAAFANYVEAALYAKGLKALLCCANGIPEKEIAYLNMATQNKVDGVIALTYSDIGRNIGDKVPIVVFDRFFENRRIPRIGSDNFTGACMAVEKLLELGCKHPVYIRFHSVFPGESDNRREGYLYACERYHLKPDYLDKADNEHSVEQLEEFLESHKRADGSLSFDGVFAHTDYHGYIFLKLLRAQGYRVPEDVQIIGFDGICKFGDTGEPFLSSMCQPIRQLAEKCVESVLMEDRNSVPSLTLLPVTYRPGGTTKDSK